MTAESLAADGETFDIVLNMEVVEHVSDVDFFLKTCASMVRSGRPDGDRHDQPHAEGAGAGIFAAENVLRWLPRGTHQYEKLVTPEEIEARSAPAAW